MQITSRASGISLALILGLGTVAAVEPAGKAASVATMTQEDVNALVEKIIPTVEKLRGLEFKKPVPVRIVDDETTRRHMLSRIDKYLPRERIKRMQTAYLQLGLLPEGTDMLGMFLEILEEQVGGYYDPDENTFFVLDDMPRSTAPLLIAHELTHALDDQHFKLDELTEASMSNNDASGAIGAVIEGSGTLIMTGYLLREVLAGRIAPEVMQEMAESEAGKATVLKNAPALLQRGLVAPYILGQTFLLRGDITQLMTGTDPEDIDKVLSNPPASTEQILHPEKYWDSEARDLPESLILPDLAGTLGKGWKLEGGDVLGELEIGVLVGAGIPDLESVSVVLPATWTNEAASGWGGDRWELYRKGQESITILGTVWDSNSDAAEFLTALTSHPGRHAALSGKAVVLVAGAGEMAASIANIVLASLSSTAPGE